RFKSREEQRAAIDPYRDQVFRQVTAAQILGEIESEKAVEPLIRVILDPSKGDVATTALLALVKIGKPSVDRAARAFDPKDPLVEYSKRAIKDVTGEVPKGNPAIPSVAAIIGM